jgi:hypothetical protein
MQRSRLTARELLIRSMLQVFGVVPCSLADSAQSVIPSEAEHARDLITKFLEADD